MSTKYIIKKLLKGGAQVGGSIASGISEKSIKEFLADETVFNPEKKIPEIVDEKLKATPKLYEGLRTEKKCKLILTKEEGTKLIENIGVSLSKLKTALKKGIDELKTVHEEKIKDLRGLLTPESQTGASADIYEYIDSLKSMISTVQNELKKNNDDFVKKVNELVNAYNKTKKGRHPISEKESTFDEIKRKLGIRSKSKVSPTPEEKESLSTGTLIIKPGAEFECKITYVNLSKGIINVNYKKPDRKQEDKEISFRDLCIVSESKNQQPKEEEQEEQQGGSFEHAPI